MASKTKYFSLRGKVLFATILPDGSFGAARWALNAPKCDLTIDSTEETVKESFSGQDLDDLVYYPDKSVKIALSLSSFDPDNLAMALYANKVVNVSGSASAEPLPSALVAGNIIKLDHERISSLALVDSAGTPASLVLGTHYNLFSAFGGLVEIVNVASLTQPFKASYSYAETNSVALFASQPDDVGVIFDGVDSISGDPVYFELYRSRFAPAKSLPLINEKGAATLDLDGRALYDSTRAIDPVLGPFGRMVMMGAS